MARIVSDILISVFIYFAGAITLVLFILTLKTWSSLLTPLSEKDVEVEPAMTLWVKAGGETSNDHRL
jgi:hypothetical protein